MLEKFYPSKMFPLIIAAKPQQPSSEQQSRIDSGISTGGDLDEYDRGSRASLLAAHNRLATDLLPSVSSPASAAAAPTTARGNAALSTASRTRSLAGHGKNLAGASTATTQKSDGGYRIDSEVAGDGYHGSSSRSGQKMSSQDMVQGSSQHIITREKSEDSGNFAGGGVGSSNGRNASVGTGLNDDQHFAGGRQNHHQQSRGSLRRDVNSFDCERGLDCAAEDDNEKSSGVLCRRSRDHSEDRLLDDGSREVLLSCSSSRSPEQQQHQPHVVNAATVQSSTAATARGKRESKFVSEEAWWDSRGLQPGKCFRMRVSCLIISFHCSANFNVATHSYCN